MVLKCKKCLKLREVIIKSKYVDKNDNNAVNLQMLHY